MVNPVLFSSKSDEWATPANLFAELDKEYGFTLDPCATPENAKCQKYFTKEMNGLKQSWKGETVFCNPPYSAVGDWVGKANLEVLRGGVYRYHANPSSNRHKMVSRNYIRSL